MEENRYIEIVTQYSDMVYRIALHDCRNRQDAEDIMQIVFMKLYQKNPEFTGESHLKYWLVRVTVNECRRLFASPWKMRLDFMENADEIRGIACAGIFSQLDTDRERELLEAVLKLPRKYRVPVYLYYYEEYSVAEIAGALGRKPSTVQTQLERARKKLKEILEEDFDYERKFSTGRI